MSPYIIPDNREDLEVKYDGRTIKLDIIINTDEDINEVIQRIHEAAKGPKKCMVVSSAGTVQKLISDSIWKRIIEEAKKAVDHQTLFHGMKYEKPKSTDSG